MENKMGKLENTIVGIGFVGIAAMLGAMVMPEGKAGDLISQSGGLTVLSAYVSGLCRCLYGQQSSSGIKT